MDRLASHLGYKEPGIKEQRCRCGHLHSEHDPQGRTVNYTAGKCSKCECNNFCVPSPKKRIPFKSIHYLEDIRCPECRAVFRTLRTDEEALIAKERERCARIAKAYSCDPDGLSNDIQNVQHNTCVIIAAKIRGDSDEQEG